IRDNTVDKNPALQAAHATLNMAGSKAKCAACHLLPATNKPVKITAKDGRFEPHALVLSTSQTFDVENTESVNINFHWSPFRNTAFNQIVPPNAHSMTFKDLKNEIIP